MLLGGQSTWIGRLAVCLLGALLIVLAARPAAAATPGSATLVAPNGALTGTTFTFTWAKGGGATWYLLEVDDSGGVRFLQWYTAAQAGCAGGEVNCAVTVSQGLAPGQVGWWVRSWNSEGFGPWSVGMSFTLSILPPAWAATLPTSARFTLVMGGEAVLDNETGLVWDQDPNPSTDNWADSLWDCIIHITARGGRSGWRLPTVEELLSLTIIGVLPAGHPFSSNTRNEFWSATTFPKDSTLAFTVNFVTGAISAPLKTTTHVRWCVRGGKGNGL